MKILKQLAIICGIFLAANVLKAITQIPLPATIIGMIMLLALLLTGILKLSMIEEVSQFFLDHLTFLFIPGGVGLIASLSDIAAFWWQIVLIIVVSTCLVIGVTGWIVQALHARKKGGIE